jgi:hypothetical protein
LWDLSTDEGAAGLPVLQCGEEPAAQTVAAGETAGGAAMKGLHICYSRMDETKKWRRRCPSCTFRTTMFGWFQEWYGWHITCLHCGEQWQDGCQVERPFMSGWRKRNIAEARRLWSIYKTRQHEKARQQEAQP